MRTARWLTLFMVLASTNAQSSDVYVLQGHAFGPPTGFCGVYTWDGKVLLFNPGDEAAVVRLIGVSNGSPDPTHRSQFTIAPGSGTSLAQENARWIPASDDIPLWITHFDAPANVIVESRIEIGVSDPCVVGPPPSPAGINGKLSFPVFRELNPPNVPKVHLGTDLAFLKTRNNVAVFNAADAAATAHIEVRLLCDDTVLDSRTIQVPPNSVIQTTGLRTEGHCAANPFATYMIYVSVVVDQPSLSWVSSLANTGELKVVYGVNSSSP